MPSDAYLNAEADELAMVGLKGYKKNLPKTKTRRKIEIKQKRSIHFTNQSYHSYKKCGQIDALTEIHRS
jgi:hypothetical protein